MPWKHAWWQHFLIKEETMPDGKLKVILKDKKTGKNSRIIQNWTNQLKTKTSSTIWTKFLFLFRCLAIEFTNVNDYNKKALNYLISKYHFQFDGANLVCKPRHQHEKENSTHSSHFGEFSRSGGDTGVTQAGKNFPDWDFKYHWMVKSKSLTGDPKPGQ